MATHSDDFRTVYAMSGIYLYGEPKVSDDKNKPGGRDRELVSLSEDYEVRDWSQKFGVTEEALRAAVGRVGNRAADVERELGGRR